MSFWYQWECHAQKDPGFVDASDQGYGEEAGTMWQCKEWDGDKFVQGYKFSLSRILHPCEDLKTTVIQAVTMQVHSVYKQHQPDISQKKRRLQVPQTGNTQ